MVVFRDINGEQVRIELTSDELTQAFFEQEREFDRKTISNCIPLFESEPAVLSAGDCRGDMLRDMVPRIAEEYRRIREDHDWMVDAKAAFVNVLASENTIQKT